MKPKYISRVRVVAILLVLLLIVLSVPGCSIEVYYLHKAQELCKDKRGIHTVEHFATEVLVTCGDGTKGKV